MSIFSRNVSKRSHGLRMEKGNTDTNSKNDPKDINNYRPIILLPAAYKIWAITIANKLSPVMNLLTTENQCAYKKKRSAHDIIYFIKNKLIKKNKQRGKYYLTFHVLLTALIGKIMVNPV